MQLATATGEISEQGQDLVSIIEQIAAGDQSALSMLYNSTNRLIYSLVLRVLGDRSLAEEILVDIYAQVWRQAAIYNANLGTPLTWILSIARSRAIDRLHSGQLDNLPRKPDVVEEALPEAENPEESTEVTDNQRLILNALDLLTPEQRQVIELAYYSGLRYSEIAEKLGQPLDAVQTLARHAMMKLRESVTHMFEET